MAKSSSIIIAAAAAAIERVIERSTRNERIDALGWYQSSQFDIVEIAQRYNPWPALPTTERVRRACAAAAALSPQTGWGRNLEIFEQFMKSGGTKCTTTGDRLKAAIALYHGHDFDKVWSPKSLKVRAFYHNLAFAERDTGYVTVDRHAYTVATGIKLPKGKGIPITQYRDISEAYKVVAKNHNWLPHEAQSVAWVTYRNLMQIAERYDK